MFYAVYNSGLCRWFCGSADIIYVLLERLDALFEVANVLALFLAHGDILAFCNIKSPRNRELLLKVHCGE